MPNNEIVIPERAYGESPILDPVLKLQADAHTRLLDANTNPRALSPAEHDDVALLQARANRAATIANLSTPSLMGVTVK